ncbi:MAG: 3-oxoacyl-ACP reductase FabG [Deltaproteobacteria bacterium]|nr:3-oxoacyl-ACP reductase FabG [Deltaproteobacteria bacterium]
MTGTTPRTVAVTGGSAGIGRAVCRAFGALGDRVYFVCRNPESEDARETIRQVEQAGGSARAFGADVSDKAKVKEFFKHIASEAGGLDVLVVNAGVTKDGFLVRLKEEDLDRVLSVNLKGAFFCVQEAARIMMKQRAGRVVLVSSVVGLRGNSNQAAYAASKAGLIGLAKSAAAELARRGITVNAVAPGYIETRMTAGLPPEVKEAFLSATPLNRAGTPEDVAGAVAFLASDAAGFITGEVLSVNGGLYM